MRGVQSRQRLDPASHFDKASNDIAYRAAVSMLSILSMFETNERHRRGEAEVVEMYSVIIKEADDFRYDGGDDQLQTAAQR